MPAVHLQILLLVGLIVFCLSLVLGCVVCWRKSQFFSGKKQTPATASAPVDLPESSHPAVPASQPLCQELRRDTLDYPSTFSSPARSQGEISSFPFGNQAKVATEEHEQAAPYFSLRRLSSPLLPGPAYKPMHPGRASLPSLPKLGLLTKNAPQRRCTVSGDCRSHTERSRLTSPSAISSSIAENPIALTPLSYGSHTNLSSANPCLHFTLAFNPQQQILTVTILNLTETSHRLENVSVLGSLLPLHTSPTQMSSHSSLSRDASRLELLLKVRSMKELQRCELRLALYTRGVQSPRDTPLGEVGLECGDIDWISEHPLQFMKALKTKPGEL